MCFFLVANLYSVFEYLILIIHSLTVTDIFWIRCCFMLTFWKPFSSILNMNPCNLEVNQTSWTYICRIQLLGHFKSSTQAPGLIFYLKFHYGWRIQTTSEWALSLSLVKLHYCFLEFKPFPIIAIEFILCKQVDWLNTVIHDMWPYLNKVLCFSEVLFF